MKKLEARLSIIPSTTGSYSIAYLMSNEIYEAIEFGDGTFTNTASSELSDYVIVASSLLNEFIIDSYGPISITFNPSAINLPNKINRIEYVFSDGSPTIVKSFYFAFSSNETNNLPYPQEPGDPRNYTITKEFYSSNYFKSTFQVVANIYQLGVLDPTQVLYTINVISPELDGFNGGYFEELHLISTRMFGTNDDILYTFETKNPNYVVPVLINWNRPPQTTIAATNLVNKPPRPYRLLEPYEIENFKNQNIKIIDKIQSKNNINDEGEYKTFRLINNTIFSAITANDDGSTPVTVIQNLSGYLTTKDGKYLRIGNYYNSNLNT